MVNRQSRLFTSESVTEGHPDKICDAISDTVLDAYLSVDKNAKVAVETMVSTGQVHIVGEISSTANINISPLVRQALIDIGYDAWEKGFDGNSCAINIALGEQSPDIAAGINLAYEARVEGETDLISRQGAGDQGIMFGYATIGTPELMPLPISLAHKLAFNLAQGRKSKKLPYLGPDGKVQVTIEYEDDIPKRLDTVVISSQHTEDIEINSPPYLDEIVNLIVQPVLSESYLNNVDFNDYKLLVNPTGKFVIGGPMGDAGLTGRKIIIDTYGGMARHGGGAFSGKDPSKVDRSGAYALRWVAKNVVAAGLADKIEVQVAYVIGKAAPVGVFVETFGTEKISRNKIAAAILEVFDLRPAAIVRDLNLLQPIYKSTAAYGHFGRNDINFPWEQTNKVEDLRRSINFSI